MSRRPISYQDALATARNRATSWAHSLDRLDGAVFPDLKPTFTFNKKDTLFTIGSCFARNIEEKLDVLGYDIPVLRFKVPKSEWAARPNGILNKFTPAAIWQEIEWTAKQFRNGDRFDPELAQPFAIRLPDGRVVDSNLQGLAPVSEQRFLERRKDIYDIFRTMFTAQGLIITLGLVEAWHDRENGVYIQQMPDRRTFAGMEDRFEMHVLSFEASRQYIEDSIALVRSINPGVKVMITTSPVPLGRTFASHDVILATMQGKSLLRTVCADIVNRFAHVDYFPSYEAVTMTRSWEPWQEDRRHVEDAFVGRIVQHLLGGNFPGSTDDSFKLDLHGKKDHKPTKAAVADAYRRLDLCGDDGPAMTEIFKLLQRTENPEDLLKRVDLCLARLPDDKSLLAVRDEIAKARPGAEKKPAAAKAKTKESKSDLALVADLVRGLIAANQLDEAQKGVDHILLTAPTRPVGHILAGRILLERNDPVRAQAAFERALEAAPTNEHAEQWLAKARLACAAGRRQSAQPLR